ncbi:MAG TPA: anti-sigma factor [Candidatus Binataceae bacterium]|nr:anti-sigma factor [Candidatus Binataceae bacterium]
MTHEELKDLLPLKALDRLEPEENRELDAHLAGGCPECERELESFREALGMLAIATADRGDPATDRIWHRVETRLDAPPASVGARDAGRSRDFTGRTPSRRRMMSFAAVAVAAMAIVTLFFNILSLEHGIEAARATTNFEVAALRARIDDLQRGIENASARIADLRTQLSLTSTLTLAAFSPDTRVVHLSGLAAAPKANATVALSPSNKTAFMEVSGLPPAPADKVYEAWWIARHAGPIRAGLFEAPAEGVAKVELIVPPEGEEIVASAVTLEPSGGTEKPTGAMYLKGDVPR